MKYTVGFLVLLATTLNCEGGLSLLGGILSTAHEQIHDVAGAILGTINRGVNLNFDTNLGVNQQRHPGYIYRPPQGPQSEFNPYDNNYSQGPHGYRPNHNGYQESNNNNKSPYAPDHFGHHRPTQNNFEQQYGNENQRYPDNSNYGNNYNGHNNHNNYGYNDQNQHSNQNYGYEDNDYPNNQNQDHNNQNYPNKFDFNNHNNDYTPNYGNKPINLNRPNNNGYDYNQNNVNKPFNVNPPNNGYDNIPTNVNRPGNGNPFNNFETIPATTSPAADSTNSDLLTTETGDTTENTTEDEIPQFIPLKPSEYVYGGDKINVTIPKKESDKKPQEAAEEEFAIDIRFKEK